MATRKRVTKAEKEEIAATSECYVCSDLGLDHAGFAGYDAKDIHLDHVHTPAGAVGAEEGGAGSQTLPIHGASKGLSPDDSGYETATLRNCHKLRSDDFRSRAAYVQVVKARMQARDASYVDDVYENPDRDPGDTKYLLEVSFSDSEAKFMGKSYDVVREVRPAETWRRFFTTLPANQLFTDGASQVRPATKKTLHKMLHTYMVEGFPTFAPVNARVDKCGHVVVFDGNHRATSHALAFGVDLPMPLMIWDIDPGDECAVRPKDD